MVELLFDDVNQTKLPEQCIMHDESIPSDKSLPSVARWDTTDAIRSLLDFYCDNGDIQLCVAVIKVLGNRLYIEPSMQNGWISHYDDLLRRFGLIIQATELGCESGEIIIAACANCNAALDHCTCGSIITCAVCHVVVNGLYSWCQICAHGGHLRCTAEWFTKNQVCPTGCDHKCII